MASKTNQAKPHSPELEFPTAFPDQPRGKKKPKKPKQPSLITSQAFQGYEQHTKSKVPSPPKKRESVLVRPTKWTERLQQQAKEQERDAKLASEKAKKSELSNGGMKNGDSIAKRKRSAVEAGFEGGEAGRNQRRLLMNGSGWMGEVERKIDDEAKVSVVIKVDDVEEKMPLNKRSLSLLDLPDDVRNKIWKYAVVSNDRFVRPTGNFGAEQPDLAMVCRWIRKEVLPVFYEGNTFAIDVGVASDALKPLTFHQLAAGKGNSKKKPKASENKATMLERWTAVMKEGKWLDKIQHWAFLYNFEDFKSDDETLVVSVVLDELQAKTWGAEVVIHQRASCVLPAFGKAAKCTVRNTPVWLNGKVINLLDAAKVAGQVQDKSVVALAKDLQVRAKELMDLRCSPA